MPGAVEREIKTYSTSKLPQAKTQTRKSKERGLNLAFHQQLPPESPSRGAICCNPTDGLMPLGMLQRGRAVPALSQAVAGGRTGCTYTAASC